LLHGAARLFMRLGIKSVNMDDVARELGVSKKTLYKHVKDKSDLVLQCLNHMISENQAMLEAVAQAPGNAIDRKLIMLRHVRSMLHDVHPSVLFDLEKYYPEAFRMLTQRREQLISASVSRNLSRGQEEGLYRPEVDPELATRFMVAITSSLFRPGPAQRTLSEMHMDAFAYHIRGIATRKGLDYLEAKLEQDFPSIS
jgi:AcrR family transcriptional regulator